MMYGQALPLWVSRVADVGVLFRICQNLQSCNGSSTACGMCCVGVTMQQCLQLAIALEGLKHRRSCQRDRQWHHATCRQSWAMSTELSEA